MNKYDEFEKVFRKRKGGGWNPNAPRRPPLNPQGNYSDILPRLGKSSPVQLAPCGGVRPEILDSSIMRSNIHVIVRIRPKNLNEKGALHRTIVNPVGERALVFDPLLEEHTAYSCSKNKGRQDYTKKPSRNLKFFYDQVYGPHSTNVEIFETCMKKLVSHIIEGYNCSIFAYGATGAGKTYTMLGSYEHPGLTFLMAMELYSRIKAMENEYESEIVVSYLEVYNETLRDLLHPSGILTIREDGFNGVNIPNLTMHKPKDASELLGMLSYGNSVRTQHPTDHNAESSRSHAVFQVFVSLRKRFTHKSLKYRLAKAKLVMVDLAGSERGLGPGCDSQRFREGSNINKSLLALSNCINALADGKKHIPYRDSKLTRILKDALGGNSKTVMIANVSPSLVSYDDTYNTLKYAGRAKEIYVNCEKNICSKEVLGLTHNKMVNDLQLEIQQLKLELETERESKHKYDRNETQQSSLHYPHQSESRLFESHPSSSQVSSPTLITPTQVIPDPVGLENFIQLLGQKKKLEEDHAEASVACKELQWILQWKKWKLEAAKFAGKTDNSMFHFSLQQMKAQYENCVAKHKALMEKVKVAKHVLDFNDKEIDLVGGNCLSSLTMEEPFLTVTLREFLYYKSLEREVSSHKYLENYYQKMTLIIFEELVSSETVLGNFIKFNNYIYKCLHDRDGTTEYIEAKYNEVLSPLYGGDISLKISSTDMNAPVFPPTHLLQELWDLMKNPVVDFEPSSEPLVDTVELWGNHYLDSESNNGASASCIQMQSNLGKSMSCETVNENIIARTPSLEMSSIPGTSSSNDILTLHCPQKFQSVESLLERGTTARTVPFSAAASEDTCESEDANTRATTATDFEEAIKYSNSDILQHVTTESKRLTRDSKRLPRSSNKHVGHQSKSRSRPGTTVVTKRTHNQHHHHNHPQHHHPFHNHVNVMKQPAVNDGHPPTGHDLIPFYTSSSSLSSNVQNNSNKSLVYDHAEVQVSEADLVGTNNAGRPQTFCYPDNYSERIQPFFPGEGDC